MAPRAFLQYFRVRATVRNSTATATATVTTSTTATMAEEKRDDDTITFEEALQRTGNGLYNYLLLATCSFILLAIGVDLFGFSLVVTAACDLNLTVSERGILSSIPFVGILMTSFMWGYISDTRGRKFTLVVPLLVSFVLSCISSLAPHWLFLGLVKFLSVCFSCAANSASYTLVGESCIQRVRSKYMLLMTCLIILSPAVAGVLAYPTLRMGFSAEISWLGIAFKPWRFLVLAQALPSGIGALILYFFFESPKFLFNCGRQDEALDVLKKIYAINNKGNKSEYQVSTVSTDDVGVKKDMSLPRAMYEQSASLFRHPYLYRSLQLYYIVGVAYITNNTFLVWLPHIMNVVRVALDSNVASPGGVCSLISTKIVEDGTVANVTIPTEITPDICLGTIDDNFILTLIGSQCIFSFLNFVISYFPNRKKVMIIIILVMSACAGAGVNIMPEPISSVFMFMVFTCTCLTMGILASYFVDLYPTSYRGMAACLSIMIGRSCAFVGINLVGNLIFYHCHLTFYLWSLLVLSSAIVACFLPPDVPAVKKYETSKL